MSSLRSRFHHYIPSHFPAPFSLAIRLIRSRQPAAWFAMTTAALSLLLTPLDLVLSVIENRRYKRATPPKHPLIFVVGAPRTGTTLVTQVLINHLPLSFINNLTVLFPRAPIIANFIFGKWFRKRPIAYQSYYGKSTSFSGPNDGLHLWDRWLGRNRTRIPEVINDSKQEDMVRFFGAYEAFTNLPILNKNNSMNTYASLISNIFDRSYFICMTRDPLYHAQSLLKSRIDINNNVNIPYGVHAPQDSHQSQKAHYIDDVCKQVLFHKEKIKEQQNIIGKDRFWVIPYEEFCQHPEILVQRVATTILGKPIPTEQLRARLKSFEDSNQQRIAPDLFQALETTLAQLQHKSTGHDLPSKALD